MQLLFTEIDEIKNAETICSCSNRSLCTALRDVKSMFEVLYSDGQVPVRKIGSDIRLDWILNILIYINFSSNFRDRLRDRF